jgi:hypothetical protein
MVGRWSVDGRNNALKTSSFLTPSSSVGPLLVGSPSVGSPSVGPPFL